MGRTTTLLRDVFTIACAIALVAACGGAQDDPGTPPGDGAEPIVETAEEGGTDPEAVDDALIVISAFAYQVPEAVPAGTEVTVTNDDDVGHTVTSDTEGLFDIAVGPGATVTFTAPEDPGDYGFFCVPHPHMTATLVVE